MFLSLNEDLIRSFKDNRQKVLNKQANKEGRTKFNVQGSTRLDIFIVFQGRKSEHLRLAQLITHTRHVYYIPQHHPYSNC